MSPEREANHSLLSSAEMHSKDHFTSVCFAEEHGDPWERKSWSFWNCTVGHTQRKYAWYGLHITSITQTVSCLATHKRTILDHSPSRLQKRRIIFSFGDSEVEEKADDLSTSHQHCEFIANSKCTAEQLNADEERFRSFYRMSLLFSFNSPTTVFMYIGKADSQHTYWGVEGKGGIAPSHSRPRH
jgi:hypothetical protein